MELTLNILDSWLCIIASGLASSRGGSTSHSFGRQRSTAPVEESIRSLVNFVAICLFDHSLFKTSVRRRMPPTCNQAIAFSRGREVKMVKVSIASSEGPTAIAGRPVLGQAAAIDKDSYVCAAISHTHCCAPEKAQETYMGHAEHACWLACSILSTAEHAPFT